MVTIDVTPYCTTDSVTNIEILACEIAKHFHNSIDQKICLSLNHEGFDITHNGLESAVKNIADHLSIPYETISFITNDMLAKSDIFECEYIGWNEALVAMKGLKIPADIDFPKQHTYCQLLGRADNNRMYGYLKHKNFLFKDRSVTTFHHDPMAYKVTPVQEFALEYINEYKNILEDLPYSDFQKTYGKHPINLGNQYDVDFWTSVYKTVSIELAYETVTTDNTMYITEKTWRPIQYGRLFMIAGSKDCEQRLKDMGFDIFDDILDKSYDTQSDYVRIDMMYASLKKFMQSNTDCNTLKDRLQANQTLLNEMMDKDFERLL